MYVTNGNININTINGNISRESTSKSLGVQSNGLNYRKLSNFKRIVL